MRFRGDRAERRMRGIGTKDFGEGDPGSQAGVPGEIGAGEIASKDAIPGFGRAVGAELLLVFVDVDLQRDGARIDTNCTN